jgi:4-amino-4-deoxy-L-arabinose transferase-like glycosyltransferase
MNKKIIIITLSLLFIVGFYLRVMYLPQNALTFGYDQARDAFVARQIVGGDLKILGPSASTQGLYHGVFYYYFLAPAYAISHNPIIAAYWTALFNAATVIIAFLLGWRLTRKISAGILSALIFAVSFEASQYATWLSNPTLGVWTVPAIYLGVWIWIKDKNKWGSILAGIAAGLSIQAEIFLAYHLLPLGIWLWLGRKNVTKQDLVKFVLSLLLAVSSMILVEFKFGFQSINGIKSLLLGSDGLVQSKDFGDFIILYLNQIGKTLAYTILPSNIGYGAAIGVAFIIYLFVTRDKASKLPWQLFLITFIFSHLPVVSMGGVSTPFLTVGIGTGVAILAGTALDQLFTNKKFFALFLVLIIIASNVVTIKNRNKFGQVIFSIQADMTLARQLTVVDYTYEHASGKPFSINTITSPLWINMVWSYLYDWYGVPKYGYAPQWHGHDQINLPSDILPHLEKDTTLHFLIKEPPQGIPQQNIDDSIAEEQKYTINFERKFGQFTVYQSTSSAVLNEK